MSDKRMVANRDQSGLQLDSIGTPADETRRSARSYLERTGNADLIDMLGLGEPERTGPAPIKTCPTCRNVAPKRVPCRRSPRCRAEAAKAVTS